MMNEWMKWNDNYEIWELSKRSVASLQTYTVMMFTHTDIGIKIKINLITENWKLLWIKNWKYYDDECGQVVHYYYYYYYFGTNSVNHGSYHYISLLVVHWFLVQQKWLFFIFLIMLSKFSGKEKKRKNYMDVYKNVETFFILFLTKLLSSLCY